MPIRLHEASLEATTDNNKAANHPWIFKLPPSTSFLFCFFVFFFSFLFFLRVQLTVAFDAEHMEKLKVNATVQYEVLTVISFTFYL